MKARYEYNPTWTRTQIEEGERADLFSYRFGIWQPIRTSPVIKYDKESGEIETKNSIYIPKEGKL